MSTRTQQMRPSIGFDIRHAYCTECNNPASAAPEDFLTALCGAVVMATMIPPTPPGGSPIAKPDNACGTCSDLWTVPCVLCGSQA